MADASENMRFLMKEFDTAPAGTREEAMMAQELAEKIHLHGLETINQDFTYPAHGKTVLGAAMVLIAIAGILAGIGVQALSIVMLILGILAAAVYGLDFCGIHLLPPIGQAGCSQNLIARHPSATAAGSKLRPVVVIAHYDTPRADIMAMPLLRGFLPYLENAALIAMGLELLSMLIQVLPLPTVVKSVAWAIAIVAGVLLLFCGARIILSRYVMPFTRGANDNMSGVAALLGLIDRVRPSMGAPFIPSDDETDEGQGEEPFDPAEAAPVHERRPRDEYRREARQASEEVERVRPSRSVRDDCSEGITESQQRSARRAQRLASMPIRHGEQVLRSLGMVSDSCEIVYEQGSGQADLGETMLVAPVPSQARSDGRPAPAESSEMSQVERDQRPADRSDEQLVQAEEQREVTPVQEEQRPAEAGATLVLTHEQLRAAQAREREQREQREREQREQLSHVPELSDEGQQASQALESMPEVGEATMVMSAEDIAQIRKQHESQPKAQPAPRETFTVITSHDEPDAELRQAATSLPKDVAQQQGNLLDDDEMRRDSILNSPSWGTSSFTPVNQNRRILEDVPDPAVAAIDPYSVSSIEMVGDYNPDDFSVMDFETGTHEALTPAMIEDYKRRHMDGFDDFTSPDVTDRKSRRSKKKRGASSGRISHRAAEMAAQIQEQEQSFADWLGVDEDYDAQKNGRQMGSWDNFADGAPAPSVTGEGDMSGLDTLGDFHPQAPNGSGTRRWQGGAASSRRRSRAEESPEDIEADRREMRQAAMSMGDRDLVSHEIWFVFTGASEAQHTGMKAFLKKYAKHLRGAYFINLECVGSGRQSLVIEEGRFKHRKADRRLVNLFGKASTDINRPLALTRMPWRDTEATLAMRQGFRGVTVSGVDKGAPAHARWVDDVPEHVSTDKINDIVDILVEVIKRV